MPGSARWGYGTAVPVIYWPLGGLATIQGKTAGRDDGGSEEVAVSKKAGFGFAVLALTALLLGGCDQKPVAHDDVAATDSGTAIDINVLANDAEPDAKNALTVKSVDATSKQGAALSMGKDGTVHYDPAGKFPNLAPGAAATDSFGYTAADSEGHTAQARVTVTVTGTIPPGTYSAIFSSSPDKNVALAGSLMKLSLIFDGNTAYIELSAMGENRRVKVTAHYQNGHVILTKPGDGANQTMELALKDPTTLECLNCGDGVPTLWKKQ